MTYYQRHIFVCENRRDSGAACCALQPQAPAALKLLRKILKERGALGSGKIRINRAGCMNRCEYGPVLVVYPESVWYRYDTEADLQEIAISHLLGDVPVERLRLK
jgi:(2Fe-2S) ferredoxin